MASRALLRRRKVVSGYLDVCGRQFIGFQSYGHEQNDRCYESRGFSSAQNHFGQLVGDLSASNKVKVCKNDLITHSISSRLLWGKCNGVFVTGHVNGRLDFISVIGCRSISQFIRHASTATAKQPDLGSDDEGNEELVAKKRKEASPEECDLAVAGLDTVKARAKAKRLQESQKVAKSVLSIVWTFFLGIGPTLRTVASMSREDWAKKLVHWKNEFKSTLQHYWLGTKLLWADVRICSRLLVKIVGGKDLSRREKQQLKRTTTDIFRLVPFAVFIVVPFMEFLLPVALKLFPNMLPSTFQDKMKEEEASVRKIIARIEYAKFLQEIAKEMAKEVQNSRSGETKKTAEDLDEFLTKLRRGATDVSNEEIIGFAKLFNDELTLDNMSRPRLKSMCKYMGISPFGTDAYLRFMLRRKLKSIKKDDKLIQAEGVESLTEAELREECRERGMLGLLSVEEMRQQLRDWLDLSLNHSLPSSLLILSRSFTVSGKMKPEEVVRATLSSLPDEVVDTVGITSLPSEDSVSERRRKLEFLEMQEELIKEEEKEDAVRSLAQEPVDELEDLALKEMVVPTAREAQERARERAIDKHDQLCELSRALAVLASASSVSREREEFLRLVNKEIELYHSMIDKEGTGTELEAMKAYRAAREDGDEADEDAASGVSSALIDKVDSMLQNLEKEIDDVDAKIGDRWRVLDRDHDGKVTPEEVAAAAMYLKDTLGKEGIQELISNLSKDKDGKILVEDIVKLATEAEEGSAVDDSSEN